MVRPAGPGTPAITGEEDAEDADSAAPGHRDASALVLAVQQGLSLEGTWLWCCLAPRHSPQEGTVLSHRYIPPHIPHFQLPPQAHTELAPGLY